MITAKQFFEIGQLAEASYANLDNVVNKNQLIAQLEGRGFSAAQADELADHWSVTAHQANTLSGFSSTLFKNLDADGGGYVLAIRGTEPEAILDSEDLAADLADIVSDGLAFEQIVDLYNEWKRITSTGAYEAAKLVTLTEETLAYRLAKAGQFVPVFNMAADVYLAFLRSRADIIIDEPSGLVKTIEFESSATLFNDNRQTGLGLAAEIAAKGITITGHSLGGHLADAFGRLFPDVNADIVKINGAGYRTGFLESLAGSATTNINNVFSMLHGSAEFSEANNLNLYGDKNPEIITMDGPVLYQQGEHEAIFIEQDSFYGNTFGHGSSQMVDSLAVYDLFIELDSSLQTDNSQETLSKLKPLFEAGSNNAAFTLESLVNDLTALFNVGEGISDADIDIRNELYVSINALKNNETYQNVLGRLTVENISQLSATEIANLALQDTADGMAYRYAIVNLSPFALTGDSSIYNLHNTTGQLDIYDATSNTGALSERYIQDRSAMLAWKLKYDSGEKDYNDVVTDPLVTGAVANDKPYIDDWDTNDVIGDWKFVDMASQVNGEDLSIFIDGRGEFTHHVVFGSNNGDVINGGEENDFLYGMSGSDTLHGLEGNDYIEGGTGIDTLIGGSGSDRLVGGEGIDLYQFTKEDFEDAGTEDRIVDADGKGGIVFDGVTLGFSQIKANTATVWTTADGVFRISRETSGDTTNIIVTHIQTGARIVIENWKEGDFGLQTPTPPPPVVATPVTSAGNDLVSAIVGLDAQGNPLVNTSDDSFDGMAGSNILFGKFGNALRRAKNYSVIWEAA